MTYERENIRSMRGYISGEQPLDDQTIKLNTNENPYLSSPLVSDAIEAFSSANLRRYPPPMADEFRGLAATLHGVESGNIIATRGGDELLRLVITTFVNPGETIAMTEPTYSLYEVLAQIQNCPVFSQPLREDWSLPDDFSDAVNESGAKLTFIVNPHAPSGYLIDPEIIKKLIHDLDSIVLIDEAYVDFIDPSRAYDCLSLVNECENLIFLRTLSKGYSLAGLRFGYGIGHKGLIQPMLEKTRDSYNLDTFSQQIATAAIKDQTYATQIWQKIRMDRKLLASRLRELGFEPYPSESNFLLVKVGADMNVTASEIYETLEQNQILVRYFNTAGLDDKLRITVGDPEENDQLIFALHEIFDS